jgi:hypothetical protein
LEEIVNIRLLLIEREAIDFVKLKTHLGLKNNSEVIRQILQEAYRKEFGEN